MDDLRFVHVIYSTFLC